MSSVQKISGGLRSGDVGDAVDSRFNTLIYAESASSGVRYLIVAKGERLNSEQGQSLIHDANALLSRPNIEVYRYEGDEKQPFSRSSLDDFRAVDSGVFSASELRMLTYRRYSNLTMPEIGMNSTVRVASALTSAIAARSESRLFPFETVSPHSLQLGKVPASEDVDVETVRPGPLGDVERTPKAPPESLAVVSKRYVQRKKVIIPAMMLGQNIAGEEKRATKSDGAIIDVGGCYWVEGGKKDRFDAMFRTDGGFQAAFLSYIRGRRVVDKSGHELTTEEKSRLAEEIKRRALYNPLGSVRIVDTIDSPRLSLLKYAGFIEEIDRPLVEFPEFRVL